MARTVLITGASRGIGRALTYAFAEAGYNVLLNYNKSDNMANVILKELTEREYNVRGYKADVSKREQVKSMVTYCIKEFNGIDVIVNNAGITSNNLFTDTSQNEWETIISTNLGGVFNVTQEAVNQYMINKKDGAIINISSIDGITGASCEVPYSASKAGIIGFSKALSKELAMSNITVNVIAPGAIDTDMLHDNYSQENLKIVKEEIPMHRFGDPRDVADLAVYLASEKARYITGQVISPNGGLLV